MPPNLVAQARALSNMAVCHSSMGKEREALKDYERAVHIMRKAGPDGASKI